MNPEAVHGQRLVRRLVGLVFLAVCATVRSIAPHGGAESAIETPVRMASQWLFLVVLLSGKQRGWAWAQDVLLCGRVATEFVLSATPSGCPCIITGQGTLGASGSATQLPIQRDPEIMGGAVLFVGTRVLAQTRTV